MAGTKGTTGSEGILTSNSASQPSRVGCTDPAVWGLLGTARLTVSCWGVRMTAETGERQPEG